MSGSYVEQVHHEAQSRNKFNRSNKRIALITGSAKGIGAQIAIDMAAARYTVIITGRDCDSMDEVVRLCNRTTGIDEDSTRAFAFKADLRDMDQVDALITHVERMFGRLDVLINNACYRGDVKNILDDRAFEDLAKVMHLNVFVPMYLIHKCLISFRQLTTENDSSSSSHNLKDTLTIINISSIASQTVVPLHLYSISKSCLSEVTSQVALMTDSDESLKTRVAVVTISPGPVLTLERTHHQAMSKLTLLDRVGEPQEIANLVMFVLKNPFTFHGQELVIDGGYLTRQLR